MTLTAKFPGTCYACSCPFSAGTKIEWTKGGGARHASLNDCEQAKRDRATQRAQSEVNAPKVHGLSSLVTFLDSAKQRGLKFPKARFLGPQNWEMRLSVAGEKSRNAGSIQVKLVNEWLGCVRPDGAVYGSQLSSRTDVLDILRRIAIDPAKAAKEYGALTCRCSFCNLPLTDAGSVEVGYGPICAANYGLPHVPQGTPFLHEVPKEEKS